MKRTTFEQILDLATREWLADWRAKFGREAQDAKDAKASKKTNWQSRDFIELYIYVHRVSDLEPGVYRWSPGTRRLEQLHVGNVQRAAAFLSLEQSLAANACFALSMIADLKRASQLYGNRGYRYVHFEAGAIGQRLYLGAEALGWNATGIGAFYDDDVHRYLGFLDEGAPMSELGGAAEHVAFVQLGMESEEEAAAVAVISESGEERRARPAASRDAGRQEFSETTAGAHIGRHLPRQVIYHFAVGKAIRDPRLNAPED